MYNSQKHVICLHLGCSFYCLIFVLLESSGGYSATLKLFAVLFLPGTKFVLLFSMVLFVFALSDKRFGVTEIYSNVGDCT